MLFSPLLCFILQRFGFTGQTARLAAARLRQCSVPRYLGGGSGREIAGTTQVLLSSLVSINASPIRSPVGGKIKTAQSANALSRWYFMAEACRNHKSVKNFDYTYIYPLLFCFSSTKVVRYRLQFCFFIVYKYIFYQLSNKFLFELSQKHLLYYNVIQQKKSGRSRSLAPLRSTCSAL